MNLNTKVNISKKYMRLAFILLIAAVGLFVCRWFAEKRGEGFVGSEGDIPKHIWTFWDKEETIPDSVKLCMKTWKKHNPDYEITLITKNNYKKYANIPDSIASHPLFNDSPQRFSDVIRLYVIADNGGIWCDATNLMGQPFSEWLHPKPSIDLHGFSIIYGNIHDRLPILESWFFAAPPKSPFVQGWRDEFSKMSEFPTHSAYVKSREAMGMDLRKYGSPEYLAIHVAAQKLIQIDKYPLERLALKPAWEGPFKYTHDADWDSNKAIRLACNDLTYRKPFMKLRGPERYVLENGFKGDLSNEKCKWI